jgi:hypothetical protein
MGDRCMVAVEVAEIRAIKRLNRADRWRKK